MMISPRARRVAAENDLSLEGIAIEEPGMEEESANRTFWIIWLPIR